MQASIVALEHRRRFAIPAFAIVFSFIAAFVAIAVLLQMLGGAYSAELCGYPDEPAHAVTGIAVAQYLAHGWLQSPSRFFLNYYRHLPKVAIGHWPPMLYLVEAAAILIGSSSAAELLALQALLSGILAWLVFRGLRRYVGTAPAFLGGAALLLNPDLRYLASMTMAEVLLDLCMFLACLSFARFASERRTSDAVWFTLWASAAILTKGSGWALLIIPPFVIVATRDWRLLRDRRLWLATLGIGALCIPWQLYTLRLASLGWYSAPGLHYVEMAAPPIAAMLLTVPGIPVAACAAIGCVYGLSRMRTSGVSAYVAALAGLVFAGWLFNIVVPTGLEARHLSFVTPAVFVLAGVGARQLGSLAQRWGERRAAALIFGAVAVSAAAFSLPLEAKPHYGLEPVADALYRILPPDSAALIVSDEIGEGAIISRFAFLQPNPSVFLLRGTKFLASQQWNGSGYHRRLQSLDQVAQALDAVPVSALVLDPGREAYREDYVDQVQDLLKARSAQWILVAEFSTSESKPQKVRIYKRAAGMVPIRALPASIDPPVQ